jgi:hypothetical protein
MHLPICNLEGPYTESGDAVIDQFFTPDRLVAKTIHVGTPGDLIALSPYTFDGAPVYQVVRNAEVGYHEMICVMVVSTSPYGGTTAGALTWHTGM